MPWNFMGDLRKREIVKKLQNIGYEIKSVNALNKLMEKMGLLIRCGNDWMTTEKGVRLSLWDKNVFNSDVWHPELVDEIVKYLHN